MYGDTQTTGNPNGSPQIKPLDSKVEGALGVSDLAFVVTVDFDGNVTLHQPSGAEIRTPPSFPVDYPVVSQRIVKLIEGGAIVVFDQNPRCIRMTIGGTPMHIHKM
jgi:hypothetical protein